jgi:uncharacterized protein YceH (UPF0502 family)
MSTTDTDHGRLPRDFTAVEVRVLGCLIEKERATPQNYPLTLNALRTASNQSTNRDPVVDYDDPAIEDALTSLRERKLTRIVYSTSNRAAKYRHVLDEELRLDDAQLAVLCVLFLRGPQTVGEIKGRTERLHAFSDLAEVQETLERLAAHHLGPMARRLERRPGQKDARYVHLLSAELDALDAPVDMPVDALDAPVDMPVDAPVDVPVDARAPRLAADDPVGPAARPDGTALALHAGGIDGGGRDEAIAALRSDLAHLRTDLEALRDAFDDFRSAFD